MYIILLFTIFIEFAKPLDLIKLIKLDLIPQLQSYTNNNKRVLEELKLENFEWKPISIEFEFIEDSYQDETQVSYIRNILSVTQSFFAKHLMIRNNGETRYFGNKTTCAGQEIPEQYRNKSYTADLVIFVLLVNDSSSSSTLAYSGPCKITAFDLRPIFGIICWNMYLIDNITNPYTFQYNSQTAIHEVIHTLGFINIMYPYYYDPVTLLYYNSSLNTDTNGHLILETPRLQNMMKQYFQCDDAKGAIMENEGGAATAEHHFERTIYYNELMTGSQLNGEFVVSNFTFQLLQDTGFYRLLEYQTDRMSWGKDKGCDFLFKSCKILQQQNIYDEFCNDKGYHCSYDGFGIGKCGYDQLSDTCKYYSTFKGMDCKNPYQYQTNEQISHFKGTQASINSNSVCFSISDKATQSTSYSSIFKEIEESCFEIECIENELYLKINQEGNLLQLHCPDNDIITFSDLPFDIKCPSNSKQICQSINTCSNQCNQRGFCINSQCICIKGWAGLQCEIVCDSFRNGTECVQACNVTQYSDEISLNCFTCSGNCQSCTNIANCLVCEEGYHLQQGFCDPYYQAKIVSKEYLVTIIYVSWLLYL